MNIIKDMERSHTMVAQTEQQLFDGINAQISAYGYATVICCKDSDCEQPLIDNPYHLVYPACCKTSLKIAIENAGFHVSETRHARRGYELGLRVTMY